MTIEYRLMNVENPETSGPWSSGRADDAFDVFESATGEVLARIDGAGADEADAAVQRALAARAEWAALAPRERGRLLLEASQIVNEHIPELAEIETRENGKPYEQSSCFDLPLCVNAFEFFGSLADKIPGEFYDYGGALNATVSREPFGVVVGVIPFNWPPLHLAAKAAPALAAGNTLILKPPEQDPLTIMRIVELIENVFPPDVLQVVPGLGPSAGAALVAHPYVSKISFTGSTATGKAVLKAAADNLTSAFVELGGKNALIVFEDADMDAALRGALAGAFFNQGEACTAASRLFVHSAVFDEFVERLGRAVQQLRVGDGMDPSTHVGPLITQVQQSNVLASLDQARKEGATFVAQAPVPSDSRLSGGFFVPPTLLTDVDPSMRIVQEEVFGPVTAAMPFSTEEEVIELVNGTDYGLVVGVYSNDHPRTQRIGRAVDVGVVMVNNYDRAYLGTPFGGTKASGYGREHAIETLREYTRAKNVRFPSGRDGVPEWSAALELVPKTHS